MYTLVPDETILCLLLIQARHGYEILDLFKDPQHLGSIWKMSPSQIYAVLKRLETQRAIVGVKLDSPNSPPRIEYHLTDIGKERAQAWLHEPQPAVRVRRIRVEFMSRLYLTRQLGLPLAPFLQRQKQACEQELALQQALVAQLPADSMAGLIHHFTIGQLAAILRWCDQLETLLVIPQEKNS